MNNGFNIFRNTLVANEVTEIDLEQPSYEAIVKNSTTGALYVFSGNSIDDFDVNLSIKIEAGMGQMVFINNINNGNEDSFNKLFFKSENNGEIEVQVIGF